MILFSWSMNLSHSNYHSLKLSMSWDHVIHPPKQTFIFTENSPNKISHHSGRTTRGVHRPTSTLHCPPPCAVSASASAASAGVLHPHTHSATSRGARARRARRRSCGGGVWTRWAWDTHDILPRPPRGREDRWRDPCPAQRQETGVWTRKHRIHNCMKVVTIINQEEERKDRSIGKCCIDGITDGTDEFLLFLLCTRLKRREREK